MPDDNAHRTSKPVPEPTWPGFPPRTFPADDLAHDVGFTPDGKPFAGDPRVHRRRGLFAVDHRRHGGAP
jgi:hypothetical protein